MSSGALQGKIAIITGAGRGIGAACAELFVREGAFVVGASRTFKELSAVISKFGANALAVEADISDESAVKNLFDRAEAKFGAPHILINNAGAFFASNIANMAAEDWDRIININLRGTFLCAREAFRRMKRGGSIVNISSLAGIRGAKKFPGFSSYAAAKAGVVGLTEVLAVEGEALGIHVNCVAPGATDTQMLQEAFPGARPDAKPVDIANIVLSLCDDRRSKVLNGAIIEVHTKIQD